MIDQKERQKSVKKIAARINRLLGLVMEEESSCIEDLLVLSYTYRTMLSEFNGVCVKQREDAAEKEDMFLVQTWNELIDANNKALEANEVMNTAIFPWLTATEVEDKNKEKENDDVRRTI